MSKSYDIFLSHSGAQKEFAEQLYTELSRQYGQYSVFFDKDSIKHGEPISSIILEYAKTCKLAVAVLSEEYLTRSKPPMLELAASYTASKNGTGVLCLLLVFLELKPEHAKSFERQLEWKSTWDEWRRNEIMSDRPKPRTNRVEPSLWRDALVKLLDTRGPVYKPHENRYKSALFAENVARVIAGKLDELSKTMVSFKATNRSDSGSMEHLSKDFNRMIAYADSPQFDQMEDASTSGETHMEFERTGLDMSEREEIVAERERKVTERERSINKRQRLVEVRETNVGERERKVKARETSVDGRERNVLELERKVNQGCTDLNGDRFSAAPRDAIIFNENPFAPSKTPTLQGMFLNAVASIHADRVFNHYSRPDRCYSATGATNRWYLATMDATAAVKDGSIGSLEPHDAPRSTPRTKLVGTGTVKYDGTRAVGIGLAPHHVVNLRMSGPRPLAYFMDDTYNRECDLEAKIKTQWGTNIGCQPMLLPVNRAELSLQWHHPQT